MSTNDTLRGLLAELRLKICATTENDKTKIGVWFSTQHPLIERIDAALAEPVSGWVVLPERKAAADYAGYVKAFRSEIAAIYNQALDDVAALNGGAVAGQVETDVLQAIRENRISLTPEYEGQWHAEMFCDEAEPQFSAEAATPLDAVNAVLLERDRAEFHQHLRSCTAKVAALNGGAVAGRGDDDWSVFFGYLIDKCEGQEVAEESLQWWLSEMLSDPHYGALFRREKVIADQQSTLQLSIEAAEEEHGSLRAAGRALGVDVGYLSRLKKGEKLNPSAELLAALGLERVTYYRSAQGRDACTCKPLERERGAGRVRVGSD